MRRLTIVITMLIASTAAAQEPANGHGPGLGVEGTLSGFQGAAFVFDAPQFHIDVLFEFAHLSKDGPDASYFGLAGRFFYTIHRLGPADLGIGGGIGFVDASVGDNSNQVIEIEGAAQIRAWIVPSVSLTASLGLAIVSGDTVNDPFVGGTGNSAFGIGGQLFAQFGLVYFFR
jgi:hypothetical protein